LDGDNIITTFFNRFGGYNYYG